MKYFKLLFSLLIILSLIGCGSNNKEEEKKKETNSTNINKVYKDSVDLNSTNDTADVNQTEYFSDENYNTSKTSTNRTKASTKIKKNFDDIINDIKILTPAEKKAIAVINSPLKTLLNDAKMGQSFTKKELIEHYKFPKEAVSLVKSVTCVGPNQLYFKWGSTWFTEKISDAKFKNDTLLFTFKHNKTYISGGAIGIKYNKKIYTDLILANGAAYIPTVKGFHWDIGK